MNNKEYRIKNGYELVTETDATGCSTYVIGDLHLNHGNIIRYCNRPFDNAGEMNEVLIKNWNLAVKKTDLVFFLGDLGMGNCDMLVEQLNGQITFIRGNHDKPRDSYQMHNVLYLTYDGIKFRFVHDPDRFKRSVFDGWTIHGHHHNNRLDTHPFFDRANRKLNVSVENIKYQPFPMTEIIRLIKTENVNMIRTL